MQRKTIFSSAHIRLWLQPTGSLRFMGAKKRPFSRTKKGKKGLLVDFYNLPVSLSASASFLSTLSALAYSGKNRVAREFADVFSQFSLF